MKYLIKSLKWSRHYKEDTWYKTNSCGYTHFICNSGIYTDEDKKGKERMINKDIAFVPLKEELINKGIEQVKSVIKDDEKEIERYLKCIERVKKRIEMHKEYFKDLEEMKKLIESEKVTHE